MPIPVKYRSGGEGTIASYDYTDIADGSGIQLLYAFSSRPAGTLTYHLGKTALEPGNSNPALCTTHERRFKFNEDSVTFTTNTFNLPRVLKGKAFVNFTLDPTGAWGTTDAITITILKNTTTLATTTCEVSVASTAVSFNLSMDIAKTIIKKGDTISLKFAAASGGTQIYLEHDPINRDVEAYTDSGSASHLAITAANNPTACRLYLPFRIDL